MSENFTRIEPLGGDTPGRYTNSLALYEEALIDGRWIGRYFSPIARIDGSPQLPGERIRNTAFTAEIDGASLHHGWQWVGFDRADPPRPVSAARRRAAGAHGPPGPPGVTFNDPDSLSPWDRPE